MIKMKFILIALCLIAAFSSQQFTCAAAAEPEPEQDESQMRQELESLPKPIDWFDLEQVRDVLMELGKNIQRSWQRRKEENLIVEADKMIEFKAVVIEELDKFMDDMRLRQKHRELAQQWREKFGPKPEDGMAMFANSVKNTANQIMDSIEATKRDFRRFTDKNGFERPFHEHFLMTADDIEENPSVVSRLHPSDRLMDAEMRNIMEQSLIEYPKFAGENNWKLRQEKIGSIKRKTEAFFGSMLKGEIKDFAILLLKEVVATKNFDMKSAPVKLILDKMLKNLALFICDILIDLLAIIFDREVMPINQKGVPLWLGRN